MSKPMGADDLPTTDDSAAAAPTPGAPEPSLRIRILVADDHPIVREGVKAVVGLSDDMDVVGEASSGPDALQKHRLHRPDVALLDLRLPGMDGVAVVEAIRREDPTARTIILTSFAGDDDVCRALRAGVSCYLLKSTPHPELLEAIRAVHQCRPCLPPYVADTLRARMTMPEFTPRERDVLSLIVAGRSNKEIGATLRVAEGTVKAHANRVFQKLGVSSRAEAVTQAVRRGLVHLDEP